MIKGVGIDTVDIRRMEESLNRKGFLETTFTKNEIANEHGDRATYYATRFACKEAVFKATHYKGNWLEIETLNKEDGTPYITNVDHVFVSITTEANLATAICIFDE